MVIFIQNEGGGIPTNFMDIMNNTIAPNVTLPIQVRFILLESQSPGGGFHGEWFQ